MASAIAEAANILSRDLSAVPQNDPAMRANA